jgi:hypothetical protein
MAWIPCEDRLFTNPMTARLAAKLGWTLNAAGGAILRLRCWCIEFAPDGDLRPFDAGEIAVALGEQPTDGERITKAFVESKWLETEPYFRVSGWWHTAGLFLRGRFKREPKIWQRIQELYIPDCEEDDERNDAAPDPLQSDSRAADGPLAPILSHILSSAKKPITDST